MNTNRPYSSWTGSFKMDDGELQVLMDDMLKLIQNPSKSSPYPHVTATPLSSGGYINPFTGIDMAEKPKPKPKPKIEKKVEFESVILSDEKKQLINEALDQLKNNDLIFEKWGFGKTLEKGKGVTMLFYGPPGTGKTLMAQAISDKLGKKLKIISTAEIESSEPGAAERNIKMFFKEAGKNTVLLFDECDSLLYDRQNLGSILAAQVNALLTALENFEGVCLFTTNRLGVLDEAVSRRLSLKMEFDLPSFDERIKIWKRMFPKEAPVSKDVNWEELAEPEIAGGHIKNAVLRAARKAASSKARKKEITHEILKSALSSELREMVKFMDAKDKQTQLPRQTGYTLRKG